MKKRIIRIASLALVILGMVSCSDEQETALRPQDAKSIPMTFLVSHPGQASRATETNFEKNDKIGLYVADAKAQLEIGGNLVNNEALTMEANGLLQEPSIGTKAHIQPMLIIHTSRM